MLVTIYITKFEQPLSQDLWDFYSNHLSEDLQQRNSRFFRWQDRHAHLFGKLLLLEGLKKSNIDCDVFSDLQYNSHQRPFLPNAGVDFNISHSGNYVVCAIGKDLQVGIDIEEIKNTSLEAFKKVMTTDQWNEINQTPQPHRVFYKFWAIKESVIKADGRGLSIPLDELEVNNNAVNYDGKLWHVAILNLDEQYASAIATNKPCGFRMHNIDFYNKLM